MFRELRIVFRTLFGRPGFTLVALATLAVGIGANTAVFSLLDALYFRPLPLRNIEDLVRVQSTSSRNQAFSYEEVQEIAQSAPAFRDVAAVNYRGATLFQEGEARDLLISFVSANYFETIGVSMARGRGFTGSQTNPEVIINHRRWHDYLGGREDVVGSAIQLNDTLFTVVGVTPPEFPSIRRSVRTDVWVAASQAHLVGRGFGGELANRDSRSFHLYGHLTPGATVEQAQSQLNNLARRWKTEYPKQYGNAGLHAESFRSLHGRVAERGAVFLGLVSLVLLIACANVANLTLVRSEARRKEMAIRSAIGASRGRLARQLIVESSVLAALGGLLGVLVGAWITTLFPAFIPPDAGYLVLDARMDVRVLVYTAATTMLVALLVGLAPALCASRSDLVSGLKVEGGHAAKAEHGLMLRDVLVVAQIAICVVVLSGAGLLTRDLFRGLGVNPGFDTSKQLVALYLNPHGGGYDLAGSFRFFEECRRRVNELPTVLGVSYASRVPLWPSEGGMASDFAIPGKQPPPGEDFYRIKFGMVGPDYFDVVGGRILQGRGVTERDLPGSLPVAVINETMARNMWPGEDPIGQRILMGAKNPVEREVVGVAEDLKINALYEPPEMYVYVPISQRQRGYGLLLVDVGGDLDTAIGAVTSVIAEVDRAVPVLRTTTSANLLRMALMEERNGAWIGLSLSALALSLGAIGLYGVVLLVTVRRTREFGVRMALGAERKNVLGLVLGRGFRLGTAGIVVGLAGATVLSQTIASQFMTDRLHWTEPSDPLVLAVVSAVLLTTTAAASIVPAWRATRVDPMRALRYE